jgi:outer membrane protein TolC
MREASANARTSTDDSVRRRTYATADLKRLTVLPDFGIVTGYSLQHGIDYYPQDDVYAGVLVTWNLFDGGGRQFTLRQREVQEKEADEHLWPTSVCSRPRPTTASPRPIWDC